MAVKAVFNIQMRKYLQMLKINMLSFKYIIYYKSMYFLKAVDSVCYIIIINSDTSKF